MKKKPYYPENIGINDCVHAKACRRLRKKVESQNDVTVTLGCFKDSCTAFEVKQEYDDDVKRLAEILAEANTCPMMLPSESRERAEYLQGQAVELIEKLTGQKWYFEVWGF